MKKVLFVFGIFASTLNTNAQSGSLVLEKGQKIIVENSVKAVTNMEMMGQSMESTNDSKTTQHIEVKEKTADNYLLGATIVKLISSGSAMGQSFNFDSDKKEDLESETGKLLKDQLNVTKEMEFNNRGILISVKKTESTTEDGNPMAMMMKSLNGAADESNGVSDIVLVLPKEKKVGESWQDSVSNDGLKIQRIYTLKELNGNQAIISLVGTQKVDKKMEMQGMELGIQIDAKLSGELVVDVSTGLVKQRSVNVEGSGNAEAMGQAIPLTTKVTMLSTIK